MAGNGGSGKVVLYVVLGIIGVVLAVQLVQWLVGVVLSLVWYALVAGAVIGVAALVIRAARRSVGGRDRRQLPR